jgi:hypothetical protein
MDRTLYQEAMEEIVEEAMEVLEDPLTATV